MNRARALLIGATVVYTIAWFFPVIDGGITLAAGSLPGWEALLAALSPIWKNDPSVSFFESVVMVISGVSNGLFALVLIRLALESARLSRVGVWALLLASLVNASWLFLVDSPSELKVGYYLWLMAFPLLAAAAHARSTDVLALASGESAA